MTISNQVALQDNDIDTEATMVNFDDDYADAATVCIDHAVSKKAQVLARALEMPVADFIGKALNIGIRSMERQVKIGRRRRHLVTDDALYTAKTCFGIYLLRNHETGKIYIGSTTTNFVQRWSTHYNDLRKSREIGEMQNDWDTYGKEAFAFEIIEIITDKAIVLKREDYWINRALELSGYDMLYNVYRTPYGSRGHRFTDHVKSKISTGVKRAYRDTDARARACIRNKHSAEKRTYHYNYPEILGPDGIIYSDIRNMAAFTKEHGLNYQAFLRLCSGKSMHYRGWTLYQ